MLGIHQVITDSVAKILATKLPEDAEMRRKFFVFQLATLTVLDGHHRHEDEIVFPGMASAEAGPSFADFPPLHKRLSQEHHELETHMATIKSYLDSEDKRGDHVALWTPIQELLIPHLKAEEAYMAEGDKIATMPADLQARLEGQIQAANKRDPLGYLSLPLILWTLNEPNYDAMVRPHMPAFVRKVLCNYIFYYKGASDLLPFVPRYRSTFEI